LSFTRASDAGIVVGMNTQVGSTRPGLLRWMLLLVLSLWVAGCEEKPAVDVATDAPAAPKVASNPDQLELLFVYGSEKKSWVENVIPTFNNQQLKTASGKTIRVTAQAMGSGESKDDILAGRVQAHVWSPASAIFVRLGNAESMAKGSPLVGETKDLVLSPVVIAMWKPMAEAMGWPAKSIGWADILELSRDSRGWAKYGKPQFGSFKFGHTHPEYSNSGISALLATLYAGSGKARDLTLDDLRKPEVAEHLKGVQQSVVHYGRSTGFFGTRLNEDGPGYLSAAVLYENMVIESYAKPGQFPLVCIYPREGTIWSDHPVGIVQREWVTADHKEAGQKLIEFLRAPEQQQKALQFGFRPAEGSIGAPIDADHGADPAEPKTILDLPGADVINASIELWRKNKKHATIALVFDRSGSMKEENRIVAARDGAREFVNMLGAEDELILVPFSSGIEPIEIGNVGANRQAALQTIDGIIPEGGTNLYKAVSDARAMLMKRAKPGRIYAIVVLTDGEDNGKSLTLNQLLEQFAGDIETGGIRVFSIGYGKGAKLDDLKKISRQSKGEAYKGEIGNIIKVFRDIATFF
jgi:Ca-activated chloride channel homolog